MQWPVTALFSPVVPSSPPWAQISSGKPPWLIGQVSSSRFTAVSTRSTVHSVSVLFMGLFSMRAAVNLLLPSLCLSRRKAEAQVPALPIWWFYKGAACLCEEGCEFREPAVYPPWTLSFDCDPIRLGGNSMKQGKARFNSLWTVSQLCPQMVLWSQPLVLCMNALSSHARVLPAARAGLPTVFFFF